MERECFFCRKPLRVEDRATVFCSPRCHELYSQVNGKTPATRPEDAPGKPAPPPRPPFAR